MFEHRYQTHVLKYDANKEIYESNEKRKSLLIANIDKLDYKDKQKFQLLLEASTNLLHQASASRQLLNNNSEFIENFDKKISKNKLVMIFCALGLVGLTSVFGIGIELIFSFLVLLAYFIHFKIEEYSITNRNILRECIYRGQLDFITIELIKLGLDHFDISKYSTSSKNIENQVSDTVFMEMALLEFEKDSLKRDQKILSRNFSCD